MAVLELSFLERFRDTWQHDDGTEIGVCSLVG